MGVNDSAKSPPEKAMQFDEDGVLRDIAVVFESVNILLRGKI